MRILVALLALALAGCCSRQEVIVEDPLPTKRIGCLQSHFDRFGDEVRYTCDRWCVGRDIGKWCGCAAACPCKDESK
jgi:hypothetical protein